MREFRVIALVAMGTLLTGCYNTRAISRGLGVDMPAIEARAAEPVMASPERMTIWPSPAGTYNAVRQIPAAVATIAYDAPMAAGSEALQLVSWTWGGEDLVTESTYRTWRELHEFEPLNPLPPIAPAHEAAMALPAPHTGWTVLPDDRREQRQ